MTTKELEEENERLQQELAAAQRALVVADQFFKPFPYSSSIHDLVSNDPILRKPNRILNFFKWKIT